VPVTELRAGLIVGSGSIAFETIRNLTERLPLMLTPRRVRNGSAPSRCATCWTAWSRLSTQARSLGRRRRPASMTTG
jgi:hypothetical protein